MLIRSPDNYQLLFGLANLEMNNGNN